MYKAATVFTKSFSQRQDILTTVFLINIRHFCEPVDKHYRLEFWKWKRFHRLRKAWKYECAIVILILQFLLPNWSLTWIVSLFHTRLKNGPIWSLITTKTLFYWANIDRNGFSRSNFSKESCTLWKSRRCAKERKCPVYMSTMACSCSFNTVHRKSGWFHPLLKYLELNISVKLIDHLMKNGGHILN